MPYCYTVLILVFWMYEVGKESDRDVAREAAGAGDESDRTGHHAHASEGARAGGVEERVPGASEAGWGLCGSGEGIPGPGPEHRRESEGPRVQVICADT